MPYALIVGRKKGVEEGAPGGPAPLLRIEMGAVPVLGRYLKSERLNKQHIDSGGILFSTESIE